MPTDVLFVLDRVMVLKDMDSEAGQHQESMVVSSGPSRDAERFSEVPKGVSSLKPVIGMLMDKVAQRVTLFASANNSCRLSAHSHTPKKEGDNEAQLQLSALSKGHASFSSTFNLR